MGVCLPLPRKLCDQIGLFAAACQTPWKAQRMADPGQGSQLLLSCQEGVGAGAEPILHKLGLSIGANSA